MLNTHSTADSLSGTASDYHDTGYHAGFSADDSHDEHYCYHNAATCPDCGGGMVRLGSCFSCPSCGYGSCSG